MVEGSGGLWQCGVSVVGGCCGRVAVVGSGGCLWWVAVVKKLQFFWLHFNLFGSSNI